MTDKKKSSVNRRILQIAIPSIISNITVPLLGLIDVTIVGHLGSPAYIGAIAVVAKVNESHPSHLTAALYPSGQRDLLVYIRDSKFSTCVRSKHIFFI